MKSTDSNNTLKPANANKIRILLYTLVLVFLSASIILGIIFTAPVSGNLSYDNKLNESLFKESNYDIIEVLSDKTESSSDNTSDSFIDETIDCQLIIKPLSIHLPVLSYCTDQALKESLCKFAGNNIGEDGNYVIAGHNATGFAPFSSLHELKIGDNITLTDRNKNSFQYIVYKMEYVDPDDIHSLDILEYPSEVTLITCAENNTLRLLVRCCLND